MYIIGLSTLIWSIDHFGYKNKRNIELLKDAGEEVAFVREAAKGTDKEIFSKLFPNLFASSDVQNSGGMSTFLAKGSSIEVPGVPVLNESLVATFRENYKTNNANKENAPISYRVMQQLDLNFYANQQYESKNGFNFGYAINSIMYSFLYVPMYYLFVRLIINYKKYSINPFILMCLAEEVTIGTKMTLCQYQVDRDSWWKNPDQKKLSALVWLLIGSGMVGFTQLKK